MPIDDQASIFVAGHGGMVGSAVLRALRASGHSNIITAQRSALDLTNQAAVASFFEIQQPDYIVLAAARVGGIHANNTYPAEFIYQNLMIEANIIHHAYLSSAKGLLFLGSSCIYPRQAEQPMDEGALLTGVLEATNEPYAIAKIAGIKLCESYNRQYGADFRSLMPTNLYGPHDNYHPTNSHVIPGLIRRLHDAKLEAAPSVSIWGSGNARREFLHVDDLASATLHVLNLPRERYQSVTEPMQSHLNVGTGVDISIRELAFAVKAVVGYEGELSFDHSKPDGAPRKLLNTHKITSLGWRPRIEFTAGLSASYEWFLANDACGLS